MPEEALASSVARLDQRLAELSAPIGIAVSGGGDSMALLHLAADWARKVHRTLRAVTVDHGLRPEAAREADLVGQSCGSLGIVHTVLRWTDWNGKGNMQDQARRARQRLISDWAMAEGIGAVLLGHTADDQAETVLLRLARGSGVDGLSAMDEFAPAVHGLWVRPFLNSRRRDLRDWLRSRAIAWAEDPSNEDRRFDRVKARSMMEHLAVLGLTPDRLIRTSDHMRRAEASLRQHAEAVAARDTREEGADLCLPLDFLRRVEAEDTPARLLAAGLAWVGNRPYRPRHDALLRLARVVLDGRSATLSGCQVMPEGDRFRIRREARAYDAPAPLHLTGGMLRARWDGRWSLHRGATDQDRVDPASWRHLRVAALGGEGLRVCPDWTAQGLPSGALLATPAVWDGSRVVAAPFAGRPEGWTATLYPRFQWFVRDR
ncbi:tRNA lysidine(34) synthetase TilS [Rubellimicrobium rubrum]|uniref:tRNA(Ile)-lysidine synthase n=2 Tax=Rubellimicrobium rubrum TaxID=2585369 RepID=A0A5C4MT65_9RHOB|nr:tRNA lysidine(34) synthetase TilS [Rubellimicrobium rubrum]